MADRIHIAADPAKLVISKSGYDASDGGLADANKVFDSDWLFGGAIIQTNLVMFDYVSEASGDDPVITTVEFPEQSFVPCCTVFSVVPPGFWWPNPSFPRSQAQGLVILGGPNSQDNYPTKIYNDRIEINGFGFNDTLLASTKNGSDYRCAVLIIVHGF